MAKGGRALLVVNNEAVIKKLEATIHKVERGTRKATIAACEEILTESLRQVPKQTLTLHNSGYYSVEGNYRAGFVGRIGYGGNGDPVNPLTGKKASDYMIEVHEDLTSRHRVGNAKFLENPIRDYQAKLNTRFSHFIKQEIGL